MITPLKRRDWVSSEETLDTVRMVSGATKGALKSGNRNTILGVYVNRSYSFKHRLNLPLAS